MRVKADQGRCEGFASCVITAPDVFDLTGENVVEIRDPRPAQSRRAAVEEAVRSCPRQAIWLED